MKSFRGNVIIVISVVVLGALIIAGWLFKDRLNDWQVGMQPNGEQKTQTNTTGTVQPAHSPCGLTVTSPLPSSDVSVPFIISGTVETHQDLSCRWILFEGQAGTIEIRNAVTNAIVLSQTPVMLTQMDWMERAMAGQSVDFLITVDLLDVAYTGPATILFVEEDPSGESVQDTVMLNVNIQ